MSVAIASRGFAGRILAASLFAAASLSTACQARESGESYEFLSDSSGDFEATRVLDTESMPIQRSGESSTGWGIKTLFENPAGGSLRILYVPPGVEGAKNHYHEFHEWAYNIAGDFTNNESTTPDQVYGPLQRFRAGDFLSRPPYSLHGGEKGRQPFMASQVGAEIMIMEEGHVGAGTWCVDPDCRDSDAEGTMSFNPDYREIKHWSTPRIIDTWEDMPWQPVKEHPGLSVKHLVDDESHGYRARMWFLEAGADTPDFMRPHYFDRGHQFLFVINGDLNIQAYSDMDSPSQTYELGQHYLVDRQPMSIAGLVAENASRGGVVWLEVTYAKGTTWTDEPLAIAEPVYAN